MKRMLLGAALGLMATIAAADPLEGSWRTAPDDNGNTGLVQVGPCADNAALLCGQLVRAFDPNGNQIDSANIGRMIIFDTRQHSGNEYRGKVWAPDRDRTYNSRLVLTGNRLSVSGCALGICREGGVWTRQ